MWLFLLLFFLVASGYSIMNLSLSESPKIFWGGILLLLVFSLVMYPYCLKLNNQTLSFLLQQKELVSLIALIQIFESLAHILFSVLHIKGHFTQRKNKIFKWLIAFPSFIFLAGLFFLQTYLFVYTENISFFMLAILFALGIGVFMFLIVGVIKKILPEWDLRAELKMLVAMFQILLAMFLPLIVKGVKVPFSNLTIERQSIMVTAVVVGVLALIGFIKFQIKNRLKNRQ